MTSSGAGSRSNGEICRPRSVSKYEEIPQSSSSSASLTSSVSGDDNLDDREKNLTPRSDTGKENCRGELCVLSLKLLCFRVREVRDLESLKSVCFLAIETIGETLFCETICIFSYFTMLYLHH